MGKEGRLRDTMKNLSMEWKIKAQIKSPPEREIGMNDRVLHTSQALVTGKKKKCAKQEMVGLKKHYFWQRGIEKMSPIKETKELGSYRNEKEIRFINSSCGPHHKTLTIQK